MTTIVKQVVGIDVSQKELVVCLGRMDEVLNPELYANKSVANHAKGFCTLETWVKKMTDPGYPLRFVMEATGVYHEQVAHYLLERGYAVSIVVPNKISNYMRTLDIKSITDATAARAITLFGLERRLEDWKRPDPVYKRLRQLSRERDQLVEERTMVKNRLHAEKAEAEPVPGSIKRMERRIALLTKQAQEILNEMNVLMKENKQVAQAVDLLSTIPGVATLTALIVLAETNGFDLVRSRRQLSSYAGLDVAHKQSGTSVYGKPRISKKGNKYLRKAMYLPAMAALRADKGFRAFFTRLTASTGVKMKAGVAVQRKLLEMTYTIFKTGQPYDKMYQENLALLKEQVPM